MTRAELITTLQKQGIKKVYGRTLSRCLKQELEATWRRLSEGQKHPYFSFSQLNMYLRCGLQYYYRYIEGHKIPPMAIATLGQSLHQTTNHNYKDKIKTGRDKELSELQDFFVEDFLYRKSETRWQEDENVNDFLNEGVGLITVAKKERFPQIIPHEVEKEFEIPFTNVDYSLKGYIDLITDDKVIIDNKTSSKSYTEEQVKTDMQLTCYSYAYRQLTGASEKEVGFDVFVKTKTPKIQSLIATRTTNDHQRFLITMAMVADAIYKNIFLPATPGHWCCSKKWCGYYDKCHAEIG